MPIEPLAAGDDEFDAGGMKKYIRKEIRAVYSCSKYQNQQHFSITQGIEQLLLRIGAAGRVFQTGAVLSAASGDTQMTTRRRCTIREDRRVSARRLHGKLCLADAAGAVMVSSRT
jgi:Na+/H+-translocating membrane pyrophosphatase